MIWYVINKVTQSKIIYIYIHIAKELKYLSGIYIFVMGISCKEIRKLSSNKKLKVF